MLYPAELPGHERLQRNVFIIRGINEKTAKLRFVNAVLLCGLLAYAATASARAQTGECQPPDGPPLQIESVDIHLELRLAGGGKLRLRGIESPRGTASNPQLAENARQFLTEKIAGQSPIGRIEEKTDRWGRRLAVLASGDSSLNQALIAAGWARADPGDAEPACLAGLLLAEGEARATRSGIWADPAYAVFDAERWGNFAPFAGQIVIAEGKVASIGQWRSLTFLNFSRDRASGPAAVLSRRLASSLEKSGHPVAGLKGARLRVRGQLQVRNAPRIEIFSPGAIEIISRPTQRATRKDNEN